MYIDARKFRYPLPLTSEDAQAQERDKRFTQDAYGKWFSDNLEEIITRLWEIDDIGMVEKVGGFVKLLKEAEFTYSFGAFQSAIALIGVCAEDLCRFFATLIGKPLDDLTQAARIDKLRKLGLLDQAMADRFHDIRKLRNDCLHFNKGFQAKPTADLKNDALNAINKLKSIYAALIGADDWSRLDLSKLSAVIEAMAKVAGGEGVVNIDVMTVGIRNLFAQATGIDLSLDLGGTEHRQFGFFRFDDYDLDMIPPEVTLWPVTKPVPVIVDLSASDIELIAQSGIVQDDIVWAVVTSTTNGLGMTAAWRFMAGPVKAAKP